MLIANDILFPQCEESPGSKNLLLMMHVLLIGVDRVDLGVVKAAM